MAETSQTLLLPRCCRQDGRTIEAYYGEFNCCWENFKQQSDDDDDKTRHFLMGLDDVYEQLRSNLLAKRPLPSLAEVYELLVQPGKRPLPADLVPLILSRLPVKSLLRFRCVSKPWLALVGEDADFATLHFYVFNKNRDESKLLVVESNNDCVVRCSDTFKLVSKIPCDLPNGCRIVSSVDGLVLLEESSRGKHNALKLWNPWTRQFHYIKPHPPLKDYQAGKVIGFGYDPLSKDYKIVKLVRVKTGLMDSVLVFSVGAGSWKTIPYLGMGFPKLYWNRALTNVVYLHGSLHIVGGYFNGYQSPPTYLLSFDLSNDVFSWIIMPAVNHNLLPSYYRTGENLVLIDGGTSLALYDNYSDDEALWVLEKETMNWIQVTKYCRYALKNTELLYGKKNGNMLTFKETFFYENRCHTLSRKSEVALYWPEKGEYKILIEEKRSTRSRWIKHVFVFYESLKLYNGIFRQSC